MRALPFFVLACLLGLSGCSHTFDVKPVMIDGRLAFVREGPSRATCVSLVEVLSEQFPESGETFDAWRERTYAWIDDGGNECDDRLPIFYGEALKGRKREPDRFEHEVPPKALEVGRVYNILIVSGATGYGGVRFRLLPNGQVENLGSPILTGQDGPLVTPHE